MPGSRCRRNPDCAAPRQLRALAAAQDSLLTVQVLRWHRWHLQESELKRKEAWEPTPPRGFARVFCMHHGCCVSDCTMTTALRDSRKGPHRYLGRQYLKFAAASMGSSLLASSGRRVLWLPRVSNGWCSAGSMQAPRIGTVASLVCAPVLVSVCVQRSLGRWIRKLRSLRALETVEARS